MTIKKFPTTPAGLDAANAIPEPKLLTFDGTQYVVSTGTDMPSTAPVDATPVSRRQMLTAMHRAGLLAPVKAAVAASSDVELQIAFDEATEFVPGNAFIGAMAAKLGKTQSEVDGLFALARTIA